MIMVGVERRRETDERGSEVVWGGNGGRSPLRWDFGYWIGEEFNKPTMECMELIYRKQSSANHKD
jgi:hypothetical protein